VPELPEVENVRRNLQSLIVGKTIDHVDVRLPRIVRTPEDVEQFALELTGLTVTGVERRGKYLLFRVPPRVIVSHLRMEGQYRLVQPGEPELPHTHVVFEFNDGSELRYRDVRQFGTMDLVGEDSATWPSGLLNLGPEPLSEQFTATGLCACLHRRNAPIKAVLLDQTCLAGLGNIYVDEALFAAGIHPETAASAVSRKKCEALTREIKEVLERAIDAGGSSIRSYVDGYGRHGGFQMALNVYGRSGEACRHCGSPIEKTRVAGRGTHFCPKCQRPLRPRRKPATKPVPQVRSGDKQASQAKEESR
jgi:formamidopyrimidine-DNA glycosylase